MLQNHFLFFFCTWLAFKAFCTVLPSLSICHNSLYFYRYPIVHSLYILDYSIYLPLTGSPFWTRFHIRTLSTRCIVYWVQVIIVEFSFVVLDIILKLIILFMMKYARSAVLILIFISLCILFSSLILLLNIRNCPLVQSNKGPTLKFVLFFVFWHFWILQDI